MADSADDYGAISAVLDTRSGLAYTHNNHLLESLATARREQAQELASRDFLAEYKASIDQPIQELGERFARVVVGGRPVLVCPRVGPSIENKLHETLRKICAKYNEKLTLSEDMKKMPRIKHWLDKHCVAHPYGLLLQKCGTLPCCKAICMPNSNGIRDLATQRQPTP